MKQEKIIYAGLHCKLKSKAAFIDWCMEKSEDSRALLLGAMIRGNDKEKYFESSKIGGNLVAMNVVWDETRKERLFDTVFKKNLLNGMLETLPSQYEMRIRPALYMNNKEIHIESLLFLVYAIVKNEKCREALMGISQEEKKACYQAYKVSSLVDSVFWTWFLQDEKYMAKLAAGMVELLRREACEKGEYYKLFIDILCSGYRMFRNQVRRSGCLEGEYFMELGKDEDNMVFAASLKMVVLVLAEDLGVPIEEDYDFYTVLQVLKHYEEEFTERWQSVGAGEEGRKIYEKLQKGHPDMTSCHACHFMDETAVHERGMELLLRYFHLNLRMLSGIALTRQDAQVICSLGEEEDMGWREYKQLLTIASLCKYISMLQNFCEENHPAEDDFQRCRLETEKRELYEEREHLQQRVACLEQKAETQNAQLRKCETDRKKLEGQIKDMEEQYAQEREELVSLRDFVFQCGQMGEDSREKEEGETTDWRMEQLCREKMIVIGGHINWQKKMKQYLPGSLFLGPDNMNFDSSVLHHKKYIIFNTDMLKHGLYYKIMSQKKREQKILYVHGNNVNRAMQEITGQIFG